MNVGTYLDVSVVLMYQILAWETQETRSFNGLIRETLKKRGKIIRAIPPTTTICKRTVSNNHGVNICIQGVRAMLCSMLNSEKYSSRGKCIYYLIIEENYFNKPHLKPTTPNPNVFFGGAGSETCPKISVLPRNLRTKQKKDKIIAKLDS